jgi:hypothetical protein
VYNERFIRYFLGGKTCLTDYLTTNNTVVTTTSLVVVAWAAATAPGFCLSSCFCAVVAKWAKSA